MLKRRVRRQRLKGLLAAGLIELARAQSSSSTLTGNSTSTSSSTSTSTSTSNSSNFFWPVTTWPTALSQAPGKANFTVCCLKALDEWEKNPESPDVTVNSGISPFSKFDTPDDLANSGEPFPCGATYQPGQANGAPEVFITYGWCETNCGGWVKSADTALTQWVQPFVGL
jgi:hypothetical protein